MRINIFKEDGKGDGKGESCGIRRFAGALTGRGSRSIIMHVYIWTPSRIPRSQKYIGGNDGKISEAFLRASLLDSVKNFPERTIGKINRFEIASKRF